jgi:signal transduction histidine kinase
LKRFDINNSWFSFRSIVDEVFEMLNFTAQPKKVKLISELDDIQNTLQFSDRKRIKQVLINLVSNGLKFTESGFIKITAKIKEKENLSAFYEEQRD